MTRLGGAVLSLIIVSAAPAFAISDPVRVETGQLQGVAGTGAPSVRVYKGIPFAAPPLGNNRWRAPQPALKWEGVRKADAFGAPCIAGPAPAGRGGRGAAAPAAAPGTATTPAASNAPWAPTHDGRTRATRWTATAASTSACTV